MSEAIQGLNRDVLIHRSLEVSPNGFITIISIIQGFAQPSGSEGGDDDDDD